MRLVKGDEPLGATAKIGDDGSLIVARVIKGGAADRSGLIHVNDRIVEVNGIRAKPSNVEVLVVLEHNFIYSSFLNSRPYFVTPFSEKVPGIWVILSKMIYKFRNFQ